MISERPKVRAFDLDNTLLEGGGITGVVASVYRRISLQHLPNLTAGEIAKLDLHHGRIDDGRVEGWERIAFEIHARRRVFPGVRDALEIIAAQGAHIYGNTGRPNKGKWVDMTYETLDRAGIGGLFMNVAFTPEGTRTAVSKAHRLLQLLETYEEVEFDEDDPRTVEFLAKLFPKVRINFIQHGTSGLLMSRQELEAFPNVRRVAVISKRRDFALS
ncbi:MAG: hypothetical protein Q7S60_02055 [bacterium]|nr:hypothetical protein [bacterium]